jgi:hypothetical protein
MPLAILAPESFDISFSKVLVGFGLMDTQKAAWPMSAVNKKEDAL